MNRTPGSRVGPYEILSALGAGGMGEVYRARDTRLSREVAVKVLAARFVADADMRERFQREARTIAQVSHPAICAIFDTGWADGDAYLVMELLEGESLAERMVRGPLPPPQALRIGRDVCAALAAAHRRGIVHRDVKPANVFLSRSGTKLLDFGLAKLRERVENPERSRLPTETLTSEGSVLGTLGYMAPEQLEGGTVDARTDLFALGVVLFEMLTGKRAFGGQTSKAVITSTLASEPPAVSQLLPEVPAALDRAVRTCLAKDPEERWQSAADLGRELAWIEGEGWSPRVGPAAPARGARRRRRLAWAAGLLGAAGLGVVAGRASRPERALSPVRFSVPVPSGATYAPAETSRGLAISPDGTRLAIEAISKGRRRLFVRALASGRTLELEGSEGAVAPFWSPDSRNLAFHADGKLKRIPAEGGPVQELSASAIDMVGTWGRDSILFAQLQPGMILGIYRVPERGGAAVRLTWLDAPKGDVVSLWPSFLSDGRRFLFAGEHEVRLASLDSRQSRTVARIASRVEYAEPGFLLFARAGALYAQRLDERRAVLTGEPLLVAEGIRCFFGPTNAAFSVSETGVVAYQAARPPSRLAWLDRSGKEVGTIGQSASVTGLRIDPSGARVAAALEDARTGTSDIWLFDLSSGVGTPLLSDERDQKAPVWSPDGSTLTYRSDQPGPPDVFEITVGVPASERPRVVLIGVQQPEDISRDGRTLIYTSDVKASSSTIWLAPRDREGEPVHWMASRFRQTSPRFSPDGQWIAYESDESGESEIYLARTEGGREKRRISPSGGRLPRWSRGAGELTYLAADSWIMAVPMAAGAPSAAPLRVFRSELEIEDYDVTPDGSRFLVSTPVDRTRESPLRVIVNWPAALEKGKG